MDCNVGGICRSLLKKPLQINNILYSWTETESLATSIETQMYAALGAVANSSDFIGTPSWSVIEMEDRPPFFAGKSFNQINGECEKI